VASVEPTYPVAVDLQLPDVLIGLDLVPLRPSMPPPLVRSVRDAVFPLGTREIVLPSSIDGRDMSPQLGQTITVGHPEGMGQGSSTSVTERVVVVALSDPAWQDDGPRSAFGNGRDVEAWFALSAKPLSMEEVLAQQGVDKATVVTTSAADVPSVLRTVQAMHLSAVAFQQLTPTLPDTLNTVSRLTSVMEWVLVILGAAAVFVIVRSLVLQRTREIGLLKALGHSSHRITLTLLLETLVVSWGACAVAAALSVVLSNAVRPMLPADLLPKAVSGIWRVDWSTLSGSLAAAALVVVLGSALPLVRAMRLDPAEALRDWR